MLWREKGCLVRVTSYDPLLICSSVTLQLSGSNWSPFTWSIVCGDMAEEEGGR